MPAPTKPPAKGGSILTRKLGPLPGWAWIGIGVGAFYLWKKHEASSAASTTAATTASSGDNGAALPTSDTTAPSGYAYQGPGVGTGGSGPVPTGAMAHTHHGRGSGVASTSPNVHPGAFPTPASPTTAITPEPSLIATGPPAGSVTAANNAAAQQAYTQAVGSNAASLYQAYVATLPAGGLPAGQPMNAQQQAALAAYNQAAGQ
jgi:hypothetical protein